MASAQFYKQRAEAFQISIKESDKVIRYYSWARVLLALSIIFVAYLGFGNALFFFPLPVLIILFFYLVQIQIRKEYDRKILLHLVDLNNWEAASLDFHFINFPSGEKYIDPHHPYSHDLDIFGTGSLFQYLNRSASRLGENKLATDLTTLHYTKDAILSRQEAIRDLANEIEFRQQCWATGKQIHDADYHLYPLLNWLKEPNLFFGKKFFAIIKWVLPVITCSSLLAVLIDPIFQSVFFLLFIIQLSFSAAYSKPTSLLQGKLAKYRIILENYARLFTLLKKQEYSSVLMKTHQQLAHEAADHVQQFSKLVNSLESRMNLIARLFGNGLFLYDFHNVIKLEAWRKQYATDLPIWLNSLAEWDSLLSFSTLHYNQPSYAFAEIEEHLSIRGSETGHPLISSSVRVANSFELGNPAGLMLITGANMAGKSTFLRAIGVNYILGLNGSPVCATQWSSPLAELRTGMRTSDSLQENQSYFFAELNRLQSIIQELSNGRPMVILLDEILKGTNSTDKQTGSRELIKQLVQQKALTVIATHDIALGDMEQQFPTQISNACFEGKIENDQLTFDYKLNKGLAQKANATFLMRKMGIIPAE
jgi:hypothetical protein